MHVSQGSAEGCVVHDMKQHIHSRDGVEGPRVRTMSLCPRRKCRPGESRSEEMRPSGRRRPSSSDPTQPRGHPPLATARRRSRFRRRHLRTRDPGMVEQLPVKGGLEDLFTYLVRPPVEAWAQATKPDAGQRVVRAESFFPVRTCVEIGLTHAVSVALRSLAEGAAPRHPQRPARLLTIRRRTVELSG